MTNDLKKFPDAHIYHYNHYEKRAVRELATVYSSEFPKGDIVNDDLLRKEKYVDLLSVAKQSIRTSEKDMSLKTIEKFYKFERKADIVKADDSVVKYDNWIATKNAKYKKDIISYNEEDCISTYHLREFLVKKKPENIDWFLKTEEVKKEDQAQNKYRRKIPNARSREEVEVELNNRLEKKKNKTNKIFVDHLKNFIGFHWKSNKPEYWDVFDRTGKTHLELEDDTECIANCVLLDDKPKVTDDGFIYSYRFNDQNYKLKQGKSAYDAHQMKGLGTINLIEENFPDKNIVKIFASKKRKNIEMPSLLTLGNSPPPQVHQHDQALNKFLEDYINNDGKNYKSIIGNFIVQDPDVKNVKKDSDLIDEEKLFDFANNRSC